MKPDAPVTLAVITGAHGVTGEVRLKLFTDDLSGYRRSTAAALTLKSLRNGIARFAEVPDRNAAETIAGHGTDRAPVGPAPARRGRILSHRYIGPGLRLDDGEALGVVVAIDDFGAGDVIEVERPDKKRFMVPMRAPAVPEWDDDKLVVDEAFIT